MNTRIVGDAPKIVMIGTAPGGAGGVAAVVETYAAHGLFQRWDAVYLPTHRSGSKAQKSLVALAAWADFMARLALGRVALLHVHLASNASFWRKASFILPALALRVGYVLHVHGGDFIGFYRGRGGLARALIRFLLRHAERVIALSPQWREELAGLEPSSRIVVIPNPVEVPAWQASLAEAPPVVLFLGELRERKGVHDLLRAWPGVLETAPGARLALCGAGSADEILALARSLGVESSVRLLGWIEGEVKEALLRKAWMLALPSHVEALPMAVLEALAAGVPVVATRVGGIPAAVEDGRSGLLIAPRDVGALSAALASLICDGATRTAMGRAARERAVVDFSSEVIVPRIEALWREIVPQQETRAQVRPA